VPGTPRTPKASEAHVLLRDAVSPTIAYAIVSADEPTYDAMLFLEFAEPHPWVGRSIGEIFLGICEEYPNLALDLQASTHFRASLHDIGAMIGAASPFAYGALEAEVAELVKEMPVREDIFAPEALRSLAGCMGDMDRFPILFGMLRRIVVSRRVERDGRAESKMTRLLFIISALCNILSQKNSGVPTLFAAYLHSRGASDVALSSMGRMGLTTTAKTMHVAIEHHIDTVVLPFCAAIGPGSFRLCRD
jgi:hypothetical protein